MTLSVVGVSFHTAPVGLREWVAIGERDVPGRLHSLQAEFPESELVLVSTCNRTEIYVAGKAAAADPHRLMRLLLQRDAAQPPPDFDTHVFVHSGLKAAEHLLAVASGLDAMVVGETEILGQVKRAFATAEACQTTGRMLQPLFQNAFKIAKRVQSETDIGRGRVSVSALAVEFAEKVFDELGAKTVMLVGAGETAELALKSLMDRGARDVLVLNRSLERGQALAERCGGRALPFDLLDDYLPRADIVISSTSAPHLVIQAAAVQRAIEIRRGRPMLLVDIAVPRDIDPTASQIKNAYVYSIDDLQRIASANLAKRQGAVDQAWHIVRQGTADIATHFDSRGAREVLRKFDEQGRDVCERALQRAFARECLANLPDPSREEIRELARKIVNNLLAEPRQALKRAATGSEWDTYVRVVNDLFGFDRQEAPAEDAAPESEKPPPRHPTLKQKENSR